MAVSMQDGPFWESVAEKWGIGLVGLGLFIALAFWTTKREEKIQKARESREDASQAERTELMRHNIALGEKLIQQHRDHSDRLEQIIKDGNKAQADIGIELKNLSRCVRCPGTTNTE